MQPNHLIALTKKLTIRLGAAPAVLATVLVSITSGNSVRADPPPITKLSCAFSSCSASSEKGPYAKCIWGASQRNFEITIDTAASKAKYGQRAMYPGGNGSDWFSVGLSDEAVRWTDRYNEMDNTTTISRTTMSAQIVTRYASQPGSYLVENYSGACQKVDKAF